ncbi:MOSC domain protein [Gemmata obscuriglobus]|uniref:MOSC domain-containing protein n=1 Tax=Gemmata obscuriglobus TaxID=114 RepID=A0A2Z3GPP7_9BACT|nr:MOSC domain-containing protein [Gemmata obscuriglobus]AWM36269.1 MOSC domain-containing protein [Gemmata obscuriglobus]QEG31126.1 MOSC domain protein [Gemmata obscuriglobus]VTS10463.1 molybdenum cofactor biosysynthesis protein : Molybdenum cofactor synthesis domain protein OS=Subdoligranulum variabile DSM 15176 GN=SUBVAR_07244 PE=4 SV=1: MOSC [Gemmata obscuriglobus UQM 2246]
MAHVTSIVYRPKKTGRPQDRYERVPAERVQLAPFKGIVGDQKGGSTKRQLNIMLAETLAELGAEGFKVAPGEMGEQIVLTGLAPAALAEGTQLRLGGAVIEVGILRTGCARFEMIQGRPRGLVKGRLGVLATVVSGGEVAVGDAVEVVPS